MKYLIVYLVVQVILCIVLIVAFFIKGKEYIKKMEKWNDILIERQQVIEKLLDRYERIYTDNSKFKDRLKEAEKELSKAFDIAYREAMGDVESRIKNSLDDHLQERFEKAVQVFIDDKSEKRNRDLELEAFFAKYSEGQRFRVDPELITSVQSLAARILKSKNRSHDQNAFIASLPYITFVPTYMSPNRARIPPEFVEIKMNEKGKIHHLKYKVIRWNPETASWFTYDDTLTLTVPMQGTLEGIEESFRGRFPTYDDDEWDELYAALTKRQ